MTDSTKYKEYATGVVEGTILAGLYIHQSCSRFLSWFNRDDVYFDSDAVDKVVRFCEKFHHYKGKSAGQPFHLEQWQIWILSSVYGWKWVKDGTRVTRKVYIQTARKQGKSALISLWSLYALLGDGEPSAEVYLCSNTAKQSANIYAMSRTFAEQLDPGHRFIESYRDTLKFKATNSLLKSLPYSPGSGDGFNPSFFVYDEWGAAPSADMYNVMKSGQLARKQPLAVCITTAQSNIVSPCYQMRGVCLEILAGLKEDDSQFSAIYEIDSDDKWDDPSTFIKSNPNLNVTVTIEDLLSELNGVRNNPVELNEFKRKNLDIWVTSSDSWIPTDSILKSSENINLEDFRGECATIGIDLASVDDLTAVSWMFHRDGKYYFKTFYYLPSSALSRSSNAVHYRRWKRDGQLIIHDGNCTDYARIQDHILSIAEQYEIPIEVIAFDPYNSTQFATDMTAIGVNMQPFNQSATSMSPAIKQLTRLFLSDSVRLDNNEITRWCFSNAGLYENKSNGNVRLVKSGPNSKKIDGCIAITECVGISLKNPYIDQTIV